MTPNRPIAPKRFCIIYEGAVAIGETGTGTAGADATAHAMSVTNPECTYRYDEPTRRRRFFGCDLIEGRLRQAKRLDPTEQL